MRALLTVIKFRYPSAEGDKGSEPSLKRRSSHG